MKKRENENEYNNLQAIGIEEKVINGLNKDQLDYLGSRGGIKLIDAIKNYERDDNVVQAFNTAKKLLNDKGSEYFKECCNNYATVQEHGLKECENDVKNRLTTYDCKNLGNEGYANDELYLNAVRQQVLNVLGEYSDDDSGSYDSDAYSDA